MSGTGSATVAYRYATASTLARGELSLATSGGITEAGPAAHPYFFAGFLAEPGPAAQALLATSAIARARYHAAAGIIAAPAGDPVVTSNADRLRFESFSACCGVHARLDRSGSTPGSPTLASSWRPARSGSLRTVRCPVNIACGSGRTAPPGTPAHAPGGAGTGERAAPASTCSPRASRSATAPRRDSVGERCRDTFGNASESSGQPPGS